MQSSTLLVSYKQTEQNAKSVTFMRYRRGKFEAVNFCPDQQSLFQEANGIQSTKWNFVRHG